MDLPLPVVFSARMAQAVGYTRFQIQHRLRTSEWIRLRRGCYCQAVHYRRLAGDRNNRHVLLIAAELLAAGPEAVAGLWSAALLHKLPMATAEPKIVTLIRPSGCVRRHAGVLIDVARLPPEHRGPDNLLRSTTPARTVADLARRERFIDAVMVADAALHKGLVTKAELLAVLGIQHGWPGSAQASDVVAFADERSESPAESRSRVRIHEFQLPPPEPQLKVYNEQGRLVGRCDFGWPELRTLGEVDGKVKYEDGRRLTLWDEKVREDALRRLKWTVVRWTSAEVEHEFEEVERRIRAAFADASALGWTSAT